jgi:uncharacterized membrane protein
MASAARRFQPSKWLWWLFWIVIVASSLYFLYDSYFYVTTRDFPAWMTFWNRHIWYGMHFVVATPILLIAPIQFAAGIRRARPNVHRRLGQTFLACCLIAAPLGVFLGLTLTNPGSRLPIVLLGIVWFIASAAAWITARRKDFVNHRRFVIRSLTLGLAFVWIRILDVFGDTLFAYIPDQPMRSATQEWIAFAVPILIVEIWLSWWPAISKRRGRASP